MHQSASAVQFMHNQNPSIIHRDIKPANILLKRENGNDIVKISDFGVSRFFKENSIMSSEFGTPYFMAPELSIDRERKQYDSSIDVFALGLVFLVVLQSDQYSDFRPLSGRSYNNIVLFDA